LGSKEMDIANLFYFALGRIDFDGMQV